MMARIVSLSAANSLAGPVHGGVADLVFGALLVAVCVTDLKTRRIPNVLVACLAVGGVMYSVLAASWWLGLARSGAAFAVGLALWFPFYLFRMIGAGDVKFFAAAATWLGVIPALQAALLSAIVGAALAVVWMVVTDGWRGAISRAAFSLQQQLVAPAAPVARRPALARMPYGVAMAAGVALAAWSLQLVR